ncbi:hypothetical protein [uncultured Mesonia sp.]|uniref:hypothetical protein n=1 Tax=uncultured Mesonia sp. TaxID=399731 RepID=UPI00374E40DB
MKYPEGSDYANEFPHFTNFLKNELVDIADDQTIVDALKQWGSVTEEQIIDALTWGNGPYIKLSYLSSIHTIMGRFNGLPTSHPEGFAGPDTIELNYWTIEDIEDKLENGGPFDAKVYKFFIAIVILHEYTHYGDFHYNGNMYHETGTETGWEFEKEIIGTQIDYDNDGLIDAQE